VVDNFKSEETQKETEHQVFKQKGQNERKVESRKERKRKGRKKMIKLLLLLLLLLSSSSSSSSSSRKEKREIINANFLVEFLYVIFY
jgi:hypothetical protein